MNQRRQGTVRLERGEPQRAQTDAARKRAAVEVIAEHEAALKRTARRYSLDTEDADDAYQRALEILLTKAPTTDLRDLIRWTQTVIKHEALAVRQGRERLLGYRGHDRGEGFVPDPISSIPAIGDSPVEQVERRETIARSREALQALKPAELRAMSLLAEGYSYAEIGELTGFSQTKINRVLAEGRDRFRVLLSSSEDGSRCRELRPLLSAYCDGETGARDGATVREHLRACGRCRATMRAYRAAPQIAIALPPSVLPSRSLLGRIHDFLAGLRSRLPGTGPGNDSAAAQLAVAGGSKGAGMAALAKLLAVCAGAAGGAAACVATGVLPAPDLTPGQARAPMIERAVTKSVGPVGREAPQYEAALGPAPQPKPEPAKEPAEAPAETSGAIEYEPEPAAPAPPPPPPPPPSSSESPASSSGSAAGEFGP